MQEQQLQRDLASLSNRFDALAHEVRSGMTEMQKELRQRDQEQSATTRRIERLEGRLEREFISTAQAVEMIQQIVQQALPAAIEEGLRNMLTKKNGEDNPFLDFFEVNLNAIVGRWFKRAVAVIGGLLLLLEFLQTVYKLGGS